MMWITSALKWVTSTRAGLWTLAGVAAAGLGWWAYRSIHDAGYQACRAEIVAATEATQIDLDANSARAARLARELAEAQARMTTLERMLADEAAQDPMADRPGLSADSLRRLDRIR